MTLVSVATSYRHPSVVEAELDGQLALFQLETRRLHLLNGSAAAIWAASDEASSFDALATDLGSRFEIDPGSIRAEVESTIEQLHVDRLLTTGESRERSAAPMAPAAPETGAITVDGVDSPDSGSFAALDSRIGFRCSDPEVLTVVTSALAPLRSNDAPNAVIEIVGAEDGSWTVVAGDQPPARIVSRLSVALRAIGEVNNLAVASVPDQLVFHAGAVTRHGQAVLLPAASNHGKSTLTLGLVRAGYGYLTDEAAAVTADLSARPFPKAIALDPGSFPLFPELAPDEAEGLQRTIGGREWHVDPAGVGEVAPITPVTAIVCPHWRAGSPTHVSTVAPTEALHLLLGEAFDFTAGGQEVFRRLVELVQHVPVYRLGYGDLVEGIRAVEEILGAG